MAKEVGEHCLLACTVIQKDQCRGEVMCFCSLKIANRANQREARSHVRHNQVLLALAHTIRAGISHSKQHHPPKVAITLVQAGGETTAPSKILGWVARISMRLAASGQPGEEPDMQILWLTVRGKGGSPAVSL